jgi:hypothetical protein
MGEASTLFKDETGQVFFKPPGAKSRDELVPVGPAEIAVINESGPEAFLGSLMARGREISDFMGSGAMSALEGEGGAGVLERMAPGSGLLAEREAAREAQEMRGAANPMAALTGGLVPDLLSAGAGVRGSVGSLAAREAGIGAGLGAAGQETDAGMLAGAAIGGALGGGSILGGNILAKGAARLAEPVAGLVGRTKRTMGNLVGENRSLSAAQVAPGTAFEGSDFILRGLTRGEGLARMADDYSLGGPLGTRAEVRMLEAKNPAEFAAAKAAREREQLFSSNIVGDTALGGVTATRARAKVATNRVVASEIGSPNMEQFTQVATNDARKGVSAVFNEVRDMAGDLKIGADDLGKMDAARLVSSADGRPQLEAIIADIQGDMVDGVLPKQKAWATRNRLTEAMDGSGSDMARRQGLEDVREALDDIIERQAIIEDPGVAEALAEARHRWRILSALEAPGAVDAGGDINIRQFSNALKRHGNKGMRRTRGNERGREFAENMETLDFLRQQVVPSSGTAERLLAAGISGVTGPAGLAAAGATGASWLFGR